MITAIQLLIFHKKYTRQFVWKKTESCNDIDEKSAVDDENITKTVDKSYFERVILGVSSFVDMNTKALDWISRLLELQLFKPILIFGFYMSISEISSFNMLLNILVIMACLLENYTTKLSCGIISLTVGVIVILKMLYQLFKIPEELLDLVCITVSLFQFNHSTIFPVNCE